MAIKDIILENTSIIEEATELLSDLDDREGQYVWKKLTAENGELLGYVAADDESAYPTDGEQDGYWYKVYKIETQTKTITPKANSQTVTPDDGKLLNSVIVNGDADLIASNIRNGIDIFGVLGNMNEGVSGIAYGTIIPSSNTLSITITHNLGVTPTFAMIIREKPETTTNATGIAMNCNGWTYAQAFGDGDLQREQSNKITKTTTDVTFTSAASYGYYISGVKLRWVVIA